jgi:PII interaction protein X
MQEHYLQHPNFGLLFLICSLGEKKGLFATLYAHRMLFVVTENELENLQFESLSRLQARQLIEERLRAFRRGSLMADVHSIDKLKSFYISAFGA